MNKIIRLKEYCRGNRPFLIILSAWTVIFLILRMLQHGSFQTNVFDLSIPDYMMSFTLKGEMMCEPFHGIWACHFVHHFTPILFLLVPLYLILAGPLFLLYLQVLAGALSAWFLYEIAKAVLPASFPRFAAAAVASTFLLFRPFLNGVMYDFHYEMFFPILIFACFFRAVIKKNTVLFAVSFILALGIKEDMAIYLVFFGLFLAWKYKECRRLGLISAGAALIYFMVTMQIIIPYFRARAGFPGSYEYFVLWPGLGQSPFAILRNLITHPRLVLDLVNWRTFVPKLSNMVGALAFLPLVSPWFILVLPATLILAMSQSPVMQGLGLHYIAGLLPFLFLAFVDGLKRVEGRLPGKKTKSVTLAVLVLLPLILNLADTKWNLLKPSRYHALRDHGPVHELIDRIPPEASVAALSSLIPHIPKRKMIFMLPNTGEAEFILVHPGINIWPMTREEFKAFLDKLEKDGRYLLLDQKGPARLYRRRP